MSLTSIQNQAAHNLLNWFVVIFIFFTIISILIFWISKQFAKDHNVREIRLISTVIAFLDFLVAFCLGVILSTNWNLFYLFWKKTWYPFLVFALFILLLIIWGICLLINTSNLAKKHRN